MAGTRPKIALALRIAGQRWKDWRSWWHDQTGRSRNPEFCPPVGLQSYNLKGNFNA
jgi:hypothetical protein